VNKHKESQPDAKTADTQAQTANQSYSQSLGQPAAAATGS